MLLAEFMIFSSARLKIWILVGWQLEATLDPRHVLDNTCISQRLQFVEAT